MRKLVLLLGLVLLFSLALGSVSAQDAGSSAYVRVAHAAINVGDVDVYINGNLRGLGRDMGFGEALNWLVVPAGDIEIAVTPAGRSLSSAIIEPTTLTLEAGTRTTVVAIGDTQSTGVTAHVVAEDYDDLSEYYGRVTVLHAIPSAGAVDILNDGDLFRGRLGYPGSITLMNGGTNDGTNSFDLVAGTYDLTVVPNGQTGPVLLDLTGTEIAEQTYYFVIATLDDDGNPTAVVLSNQ